MMSCPSYSQRRPTDLTAKGSVALGGCEGWDCMDNAMGAVCSPARPPVCAYADERVL